MKAEATMPDIPYALFSAPLHVINIGLQEFAHALTPLHIPVVHVQWSPPANGDPHLIALLERLAEHHERIEHANAAALACLANGEPVLIDCRPAHEALALPPRTVLHAGPPIAWSQMCAPVRAAVLCAIRYEGWAADDEAVVDVRAKSLGDFSVSYGSEQGGGSSEGTMGASGARMLLMSEKDILDNYRIKGP